jgi:hypothetical protein
MTDPAIKWFLDDAKRQGLSVREYEAKYGILLLPKQHEIAARERPIEAAFSAASDLFGRPLSIEHRESFALDKLTADPNDGSAVVLLPLNDCD